MIIDLKVFDRIQSLNKKLGREPSRKEIFEEKSRGVYNWPHLCFDVSNYIMNLKKLVKAGYIREKKVRRPKVFGHRRLVYVYSVKKSYWK